MSQMLPPRALASAALVRYSRNLPFESRLLMVESRARKWLVSTFWWTARADNAIKRFSSLSKVLEHHSATARSWTLNDIFEQIHRRSRSLIPFHEKRKVWKRWSTHWKIKRVVLACAVVGFSWSDETKNSVSRWWLSWIKAVLDAWAMRKQTNTKIAVQLMTLHSAKKVLEFPLVFLTVWKKYFSQAKCVWRTRTTRRRAFVFCYVGITRAMEKLYITLRRISPFCLVSESFQ